ncbi:hypothetical protein PINS_up001001 [Pythium insidiosum]|nr:hypothetical protein PINS_up001001 [Pythium insidiosum]
MTTRCVLLEAIRMYPWNWSAWMELAALSPFTSSVRRVSDFQELIKVFGLLTLPLS